MIDAVDLTTFFVHGGANFDGRRISAVIETEIDDVAERIAASGIAAVAVSAAFSPLAPNTEYEVADLLHSRLPGLTISLSSEVGRLGLLERENATILNAALSGLAATTFAGFERALVRIGLSCPLFISQNDGTVMSAEYATRYPVRTLSSGPTNSMRGAAFLSGLDRAVVLDVGGTTADAGALVGGFPREAPAELSIEGIRTNFRMPDVVSVGIGGGSDVVGSEGGVTIGPTSVGYEIGTRALVFGGRDLTTTDVAVRAGLAMIGDPANVAHLQDAFVETVMTELHRRIDELIAIVRGSAEPVPVIVVGGGSVIIDPARLTEATEVIVPDYFQVANAVGASIPQVSGEIDRIVSLGTERDAVIAVCRTEAVAQAVAAGADPSTVTVLDEEVTTLNLLGQDSARVRVRAVGAVSAGRFAAIRIHS